MNLQNRVLKYLYEAGFTGFVRDEFPEIIAWAPLRNTDKDIIKIPTTFIKSNKREIIVPFIVIGITCKKPTKKQIELAGTLLGNCFSNISIASLEKGKVSFDAIVLEEEVKDGRRGHTSYIG